MLGSLRRKLDKPLPAEPGASSAESAQEWTAGDFQQPRQRKRDVFLFRSTSAKQPVVGHEPAEEDDPVLREALEASRVELDARKSEDDELATALLESTRALQEAPEDAQLQVDLNRALAASLVQPRLPPGAGHSREKDVEQDELEEALELSLAEHETRLAYLLESERVSAASDADDHGRPEPVASSSTSVATPEPVHRVSSPAVWFTGEPAPPIDPTPAASVAEQATEAVNDALDGALLGHGVRFGHPEPCAATHACEDDGLRSRAPFPTRIGLERPLLGEGVSDGKAAFALEASTWAALLRLMTWYGDVLIDTTEDGGATSLALHITLQFRETIDGGAVRCLLSLQEDNGRDDGPANELSGQLRADFDKQSVVRSSISLPDRIPLPSRLSIIAARLFTLRQLASIASSTVASKSASQTYKLLQQLGRSIDALATEHKKTEPVTTADELKWLQRLRVSLRKKPAGVAAQSAEQAAVELAAPAEDQPSDVAHDAAPVKAPRPQPRVDSTRYLPDLLHH